MRPYHRFATVAECDPDSALPRGKGRRSDKAPWTHGPKGTLYLIDLAIRGPYQVRHNRIPWRRVDARPYLHVSGFRPAGLMHTGNATRRSMATVFAIAVRDDGDFKQVNGPPGIREV